MDSVLKDINLLYAEDNEEIAKEMSFFLARRVKNLYVAKDGVEALVLFKQEKPDIVISDIQMPNMDGMELAKAIKALSKDTPIIFMTAFNESKHLSRAIEIGVESFLTKPVNFKKVISTLERSATLVLHKKEKEFNYRYIRFILDINPSFLVVVKNKKIDYINKTFLSYLGLPSLEKFIDSGACLGAYIDSINSEKLVEKEKWVENFLSGNINKIVVNLKTRSQEHNAFLVAYNQIFDTQEYIFTFTEITQLDNERRKFKDLSLKDNLTGIYNRNHLEYMYPILYEKTQDSSSSLVFVMMDIDHFKKVNDTHGHQIGDDVLKEVSSTISNNLRDEEYFFRWGGEEFVLLLTCISLEKASEIVSRVRAQIEKERFTDKVLRITCSFGLCLSDINIEESIRHSDKALYDAKAQGRNRVVTYRTE